MAVLGPMDRDTPTTIWVSSKTTIVWTEGSGGIRIEQNSLIAQKPRKKKNGKGKKSNKKQYTWDIFVYVKINFLAEG